MYPSDHPRQWKRIAAAAALFLVLGAGMSAFFLRGAAGRESFPIDDAWIHQVYARNLAAGEGFAYNAPEAETGFTSPLWVLCLAGLKSITDASPDTQVLTAKVLGFVFLFLAAMMGWRLGGFLAGLFLILDPRWHFAAHSGMELTLLAFLTLLALDAQARGAYARAGLAAAGAFLTRPEGALVPGVLFLLCFWPGRNRTHRGLHSLLCLVPCLVAAGLWIAFCHSVTGRPFPNTFYCKLGPILQCAVQDLPSFLYTFLADGQAFLAAATVLAGIAALALHPRRATLGLGLISLGLLVGVWATRPILRIEAFYWERYLIPALAGLHVLAGIGCLKLWNRSGPGKILAAALTLLILVGFAKNLEDKARRFENNCRDVARFNEAAGHWVARNTGPGEVVAVQDAGAIRYFGERPVIDLAGLNNHALADPAALQKKVDISDLTALARHAGSDWLILFRRHYSGRSGFVPYHEISYNDYTLYGEPERARLLILKKSPTR